MKVNKIKFLSGPNLYSFKPTLWIELDIEELEDKPSNELPGFTDRLLEAIPSLQTHTCSRGYPGGFVERLREGTWMGHILEHMALEIQHLAGIPVKRGKTITAEKPGIYYVTFDYREPESGRYAFESALEIAGAILAGRPADAAPYIEKTSELYYANKLGPSTEAIYEAALVRKIPAERIGTDSTLRLGTGSRQKSVQATVSSQTSYLAVERSCDKEMTKLLLEQAGMPVPEGRVIDNPEAMQKAAEELGYPLVLKPLKGRQGQAVLTNLQNAGQLETAYNFARKEFPDYDTYILERFFPGRDYRFTVVGGKLAAVSLRQPPYVTGDGVSSIRDLIARENSNPLRGKGHEKPMTEIPLEQAECYLGKTGFALDDIPAAGLQVQVIGNANLSTGGSSEDVTARVHPSYAELAVRAAEAIGLDIAGVDIISDNIAGPYRAGHGCILEVNAAPGIRMHQHPSLGEPRDVGGAIVDYLFADRREAAIPLAAVTGTNGKTTTVRLLAHLLQNPDRRVGMTCSDGIWIGGTCVEQGDCSGPRSARKVLARQDVDAAVLETARGGIMREGLAFRWCDVGIVTNVAEDHLGQDGLETLEDLRKVKRTVPETVLPGGACVLNADDEGCVAMAGYTKGSLVFFSLTADNLVVQEAIRQGDEAWYLDGEWIMYASDKSAARFLKAADIPLTIGGLARHNIANVLAALAAGRSMGLSPEEMRGRVMTFLPSPEQSRGRFNRFEAGGRLIIADYGHNPSGLQAVYEAVNAMKGNRLITVASAPGDRTDKAIRELGAVIGEHSDLFVIKEDEDRRGRAVMESAALLREGALSAGLPGGRMITVLNELESFQEGWKLTAPGDILLMFYDNYNYVEQALEEITASLERKRQADGAGSGGWPVPEQIPGPLTSPFMEIAAGASVADSLPPLASKGAGERL